MTVITIDVISDVVCAWCYIGKRVLSRAIEIHQKTYPGGKDDVFNVQWRPYYLNHHLFPHSMDKAEVAKIKLAGWSPEKVAAGKNRVNQAGRSVGIVFKAGGKIGRTRDAHRLIHLCQTGTNSTEVQNGLVEGLFKAYHEQERDISEWSVLREIAANAGLDGRDVDKWLESDMGGDTVDDEAAKNREVVNAGVPLFVVQGEYRVDGAQDPQDFLEIFCKVKETKSEV